MTEYTWPETFLVDERLREIEIELSCPVEFRFGGMKAICDSLGGWLTFNYESDLHQISGRLHECNYRRQTSYFQRDFTENVVIAVL